MPTVALFGAGNVAVGVLTSGASSEMKRNIYSKRFRFAAQLSGMGGCKIFIGEGLQVPGALFWLLKGCQIYLEGAVMVGKRLFVPEGHLCWREGQHICLELRRATS